MDTRLRGYDNFFEKMKLKEILDIAVQQQCFFDAGYRSFQEIFDDLYSFASRNEQFGYTHDNEHVFYPFDLEKDVKGDFVVIDSIPHYPGFELHTFSSIINVQKHLISDNSFLNAYTGFSFVLKKDTILEYEIWYTTESGKDSKFEKEKQTEFGAKYPFARVEWLNLQIANGS